MRNSMWFSDFSWKKKTHFGRENVIIQENAMTTAAFPLHYPLLFGSHILCVLNPLQVECCLGNNIFRKINILDLMFCMWMMRYSKFKCPIQMRFNKNVTRLKWMEIKWTNKWMKERKKNYSKAVPVIGSVRLIEFIIWSQKSQFVESWRSCSCFGFVLFFSVAFPF